MSYHQYHIENKIHWKHLICWQCRYCYLFSLVARQALLYWMIILFRCDFVVCLWLTKELMSRILWKLRAFFPRSNNIIRQLRRAERRSLHPKFWLVVGIFINAFLFVTPFNSFAALVWVVAVPFLLISHWKLRTSSLSLFWLFRYTFWLPDLLKESD